MEICPECGMEICPECGEETTCDEVDIGVGIMHSPYRCNNCGWNQEAEIQETMRMFGIGKSNENPN